MGIEIEIKNFHLKGDLCRWIWTFVFHVERNYLDLRGIEVNVGNAWTQPPRPILKTNKYDKRCLTPSVVMRYRSGGQAPILFQRLSFEGLYI